jgi:hypothetical protein
MAARVAAGTMTDRPPPEPSRPTGTSRPAAATTGGRESSAAGGAMRRAGQPLRAALPLATMTLATFLVLFAVLMARLSAGADPALRPGAVALVAKRAGPAALTTRTSGGTSSAVSPIARPEAASPGEPAIVTRASSGGAAERDD